MPRPRVTPLTKALQTFTGLLMLLPHGKEEYGPDLDRHQVYMTTIVDDLIARLQALRRALEKPAGRQVLADAARRPDYLVRAAVELLERYLAYDTRSGYDD